MKHSSLLRAIAVVPVLIVACAPDQPAITTTCTTLADCPVLPPQVCDRATSKCIPEPNNRLLGSFECIFDRPRDIALQASQIIANVEGDRYTLSQAYCQISAETGSILFGFQNPNGGDASLRLALHADDARTGRVVLGPDYDDGNSAVLETGTTRIATSLNGYFEIKGEIAAKSSITGYVDVTILPATPGTVFWGKPCPQGTAECGQANRNAGGALLCSVATTESKTRICTKTCQTSGECALGDGSCVEGVCTKSCKTDRDCIAPARCLAGVSGSGCF